MTRADATRRGRGLQRLGSAGRPAVFALAAACLLAAAGCAAQGPAAAGRAEDGRPALVGAMRGRYAITRGGEPAGEEVFTITSSGGVWRAEGTLSIAWPIERTQGYVLEIDERTREPIAFEAWIEVIGERQRIRGERREAYFAFEMETIRGKRSREIPYALGTVIDFASPIASTLALSLLGPTLEPKKPVQVRAIAVTVPALEPAVMMQTYELRGTDGDARKIALSSVGAVKPIALWVRPDGLPIRVRTWVDEGPPFELRLVAPE